MIVYYFLKNTPKSGVMESCITVLVLYGELSVVSQEDLNNFFVTLMTGHLESRLPRTLLVHLQVISTPWVVSLLTSQTVLVKPLQSIKRLSVTNRNIIKTLTKQHKKYQHILQYTYPFLLCFNLQIHSLKWLALLTLSGCFVTMSLTASAWPWAASLTNLSGPVVSALMSINCSKRSERVAVKIIKTISWYKQVLTWLLRIYVSEKGKGKI